MQSTELPHSESIKLHLTMSLVFVICTLVLVFMPRFPDFVLVFACSSLLVLYTAYGKSDIFFVCCMTIPSFAGLVIFGLRVKLFVSARVQVKPSTLNSQPSTLSAEPLILKPRP